MSKQYSPPISVTWCPSCLAVLTGDQVRAGHCRRCGTDVGVDVGLNDDYFLAVNKMLTQIGQEDNGIQERLSSVRHVVALLSGNGGVGKSAICANLAASLATQGFRVGVLDADLSTPSLTRVLGVSWQPMPMSEAGVSPLSGPLDIQVMSISSFLPLPEDGSQAVKGEPLQNFYIWQDVSGAKALRDLLSGTLWGDLDVLFLDLPQWHDLLPTIAKFLPQLEVLVVTIPLETFHAGSVNFLNRLRQLHITPLALVENMVGNYCLNCAKLGPLCGRTSFCKLMWRESSNRPAPPAWRQFSTPFSAQELSKQLELAFWGSIPFDPRLQRSMANGKPVVLEYPRSPSAQALGDLARRVGAWLQGDGGNGVGGG